jgi:DNA polymerase II large subunit
MRRDCDGEETSVILLLDCFLNFSQKYLPDKRGARSMDAPLVLSTVLNPMEVDDECYFVNNCWNYPLEFYEAAEQYKKPWEIKIEQIKDRLNKPEQYEGMGFTHNVSNINQGVVVSAYKSIPTMIEKVDGQIDLAKKIRAVSLPGVAALVVEKHFLRDIKGNLRKFSIQGFRCVKCNAKYRRPPISGICSECNGGKLVFTIAEGSVKKYLEHSLKLVKFEGVSPYLQQSMELLKGRVEEVFGVEKTKQISLGEFV